MHCKCLLSLLFLLAPVVFLEVVLNGKPVIAMEAGLEIERHLKTINKIPIKTRKDYIDFIDVDKQPAFDHPLIGHTTQNRKSQNILRGSLVPRTQYDSFIFTLQWSSTYCATHPCNPLREKNTEWTIHGLWPQKNGNPVPIGDSECVEYSEVFDLTKIPQSLQDDLHQHWPNMLTLPERDYEFWRDEWEKHGVCSTVDFNLQDYFTIATEMVKFDMYGLTTILSNNGFGSNIETRAEKVRNALTTVEEVNGKQIKRSVTLVCIPWKNPTKQKQSLLLYQVYFYITPELKPIEDINLLEYVGCKADDLISFI